MAAVIPYLQDPDLTLYNGDAVEVLRELPDESVDCCVTSPPYWRQRVYGVAGEHGLENTPEAYVESLREVFAEVRRVLHRERPLWLNVGDKFATGGFGGGGSLSRRKNWTSIVGRTGWDKPPPGFKDRDLTLTPFRLADALRADGWILRQTVMWKKGAAVEPPRRDRPATSHEYVFLFVKRPRPEMPRDPGEPWWHSSVWSIANDGDGSHSAMMPLELARRCIIAGCKEGELVLDPFLGSGTVALAARNLGRRSVGIDLSPDSCVTAARRTQQLSLEAQSA